MAIAERGLALFVTLSTAILALLLARVKEDYEILRGLLPMCAGCQKIRNEGIWQHLEKYVRAKSDVQFSRTLCPDCRKKWTPRAVGAH